MVQAVTLTLDPLPTYLKAGEYPTFSGQMMFDTTPAPPTEIIEIRYDGNVLISTVTMAGGTFSVSPIIPYDLACKTWAFKAYHPDSGTSSPTQTRPVAFNTRLSISAPATVGKGLDFQITGKLEYESAYGVWSPLTGKTVALAYNTTSLGTATTAPDGSYSKTVSIGATGTFTLTASFAGEGLLARAMAFLGLEVPSIIIRVAVPALVGIVALALSLKR